MSAIPDDILATTARLSAEATRPFPNSRKIYVEGSRPDLRVPMREVRQTPTVTTRASRRTLRSTSTTPPGPSPTRMYWSI